MSDLRESGSLEQDADIVMFLHRPEAWENDETKKDTMQLKISKHRNGPTGVIELLFQGELARFVNVRTWDLD